MHLVPSDVKRGSITHRFDREEIHAYRKLSRAPRRGDLALARVERTGHPDVLETRSGRTRTLFAGDHLVGVFGTRHDPDWLEGVVPPRLRRCHLLAPCGLLGQVQSRHRRVSRPTELEILGYVYDAEGRRVQLDRHRLEYREAPHTRPVALVLGRPSRPERVDAAALVVRTLAGAGISVGAARITGTPSRAALLGLKDAGAARALDFTAFGHASTYRLEEAALMEIFTSAIGHLVRTGVEVVVLEIGDDLLDREAELLLARSELREHVGAVFFRAADLVHAQAAWDRLVVEHGLPLLAVCGPVADLAMGVRSVEDRLGIPCLADGPEAPARLREVLAAAWPDRIGPIEPEEGMILTD